MAGFSSITFHDFFRCISCTYPCWLVCYSVTQSHLSYWAIFQVLWVYFFRNVRSSVLGCSRRGLLLSRCHQLLFRLQLHCSCLNSPIRIPIITLWSFSWTPFSLQNAFMVTQEWWWFYLSRTACQKWLVFDSCEEKAELGQRFWNGQGVCPFEISDCFA